MLQQQTMLRISRFAGMHDRAIESLKNLAILTLPHDLPNFESVFEIIQFKPFIKTFFKNTDFKG